MAIIHEHAVMRALSGEDLRPHEGCAVKKDASGKLVLCAASDTNILGIVHVGGDKEDWTDYILPAHSGIVGLKLHGTPGTVAEGTTLVLAASGRIKALPTTAGSYLAIGRACETGEADQLIEATLMAPRLVTVS